MIVSGQLLVKKWIHGINQITNALLVIPYWTG